METEFCDLHYILRLLGNHISSFGAALFSLYFCILPVCGGRPPPPPHSTGRPRRSFPRRGITRSNGNRLRTLRLITATRGQIHSGYFPVPGLVREFVLLKIAVTLIKLNG